MKKRNLSGRAMTCGKRVERAISASVDGDLDREQQQALDAHLESCEACRALSLELSALRSLSSELGDHEPPVDLLARSFDALEQHERRQLFRWPALVSVAAAAALAAMVLTMALQESQPDDLLPTRTLASGTSMPSPKVAGVLGSKQIVTLGSKSKAAPQKKGELSDAQLLDLATAEFARAEKHYRKAIGALRVIATRESKSWDANRRAAYQKRLALIDSLVTRVRRAAATSPHDPKVKEMLFFAYREQIRFLRSSIWGRPVRSLKNARDTRFIGFDEPTASDNVPTVLKGTL
jgi:hypothetical protein